MKYIVDFYAQGKYTYSNFFAGEWMALATASAYTKKDGNNGARVITYNERGGHVIIWEGGNL